MKLQETKKEIQHPSREQVVKDFFILDDELVLDVGCGPGAPELFDVRNTRFQRADVLVDINPNLIQVYKKTGLKFVVANAEALPFKDKVFGFVWSYHLLEHLNFPAKACKEIARVGYRGRIKTPTKFKELIRPNGEHLWMVSQFDDHLVFEKKYNFLHTPLWKNAAFGDAMSSWLRKSWNNLPGILFEVVFDWFDTINCIEITSTEKCLPEEMV